MSSRVTCAVAVRWMNRSHMPAVREIENHSFEFPWSEEDFIRCLRQRNCIGMVAEVGKQVVGFMIYELHKTCLRVLNFAVHEDCRFKGAGTAMVKKLIGKLTAERRRLIVIEIRETNLDAQLFFRRMGFRAVDVSRGFYEDTPEDAYIFNFRYKSP